MISWRISSSKDFSVGMRSGFAELETAENAFWDVPFWEFRRKINVAMSLFTGTAVTSTQARMGTMQNQHLQ
jgi:hypothetical protein